MPKTGRHGGTEPDDRRLLNMGGRHEIVTHDEEVIGKLLPRRESRAQRYIDDLGVAAKGAASPV